MIGGRAGAAIVALTVLAPLYAACSGGTPRARTPTSAAVTPPASAGPPTIQLSPTLPPSPAAPTPTTAEPSPAPSPSGRGVAVYLSIGDSIQYGCCHDRTRSSGELFRAYLEQRLGRPVEWVTVAGNDTADSFIHGLNGGEPQMQRAIDALAQFKRDGRPVVAITMSIGGNDYVEVGQRCAGDQTACPRVFGEILARLRPQLPEIYAAINEARDPATPLFLVTYYNASDCGQPGVEQSPTDTGQRVWNATISAAARPFGFFLVDLYAPFKGKACEYIENVDPTYAGYAVIAQEYEKAYDALPTSYVEPFRAAR